MALDISKRHLPPGYLVNRQGAPARRNGGKFYCGRMVMRNDPTTDGYCGPNDGNNCISCRRLDEHSQYVYLEFMQ
jgi:hypothetical protein